MKKKKEQEVISRLSTVATSLLEAVKHGQLFHGSTPYATNGEKEKKKERGYLTSQNRNNFTARSCAT